MTYKTAQIENYIVKNYSKFRERPSPAHLQNILYYANGIYLAKFNKTLLNIGFAATKFGVINLQLDLDNIEIVTDKDIKKFLNVIISYLSNVKEEELSKFIRQQNSPWHNAKMNSKIIDNKEIKEFFLDYISKYPYFSI